MAESVVETVLEEETLPEEGWIPTHIIVQRQLQDIILTQKAAIQRLGEDISLQESSLRDSFLSRDQYQDELHKLERRINDDYVSKSRYDDMEKQLEEERIEHSKTKRKLTETSDRLEFALGEIEILTKQLEREKASFEQAFGSIRSKTMEVTSKKMQLETKCNEINKKVEKQEEILSTKSDEIQNLKQKLKKKDIEYKKQLTEAEIQRKQEQYINKMIAEKDKKNKNRIHTLDKLNR